MSDSVCFFNRYTGRVEHEAIFGEKPLRWAYETRLGQWCLETVLKRSWFSTAYGRWADTTLSAREIAPFLENFEVDASEFQDPVDQFRTFNEFFHRKLKPEARPICPGGLCFAADGRHLYVPDLSEDAVLYAKGQAFSWQEFLQDDRLAEEFRHGSAVFSRLCPTDYHRFHFPADGTPGEPRLINGFLYSVNPIALSRRISYLWENKRRVTRVTETGEADYLFLEIGATNVGSIVDTCPAGVAARKGEERGYFRFGGSMVATIFPPGAFVPSPDLAEQSARGLELYARMGDHMGDWGW